MNYEKMSRAIRFGKQSGHFEYKINTKGRKENFVFSFGKKSLDILNLTQPEKKLKAIECAYQKLLE